MRICRRQLTGVEKQAAADTLTPMLPANTHILQNGRTRVVIAVQHGDACRLWPRIGYQDIRVSQPGPPGDELIRVGDQMRKVLRIGQTVRKQSGEMRSPAPAEQIMQFVGFFRGGADSGGKTRRRPGLDLRHAMEPVGSQDVCRQKRFRIGNQPVQFCRRVFCGCFKKAGDHSSTQCPLRAFRQGLMHRSGDQHDSGNRIVGLQTGRCHVSELNVPPPRASADGADLQVAGHSGCVTEAAGSSRDRRGLLPVADSLKRSGGRRSIRTAPPPHSSAFPYAANRSAGRMAFHGGPSAVRIPFRIPNRCIRKSAF